MGISRVNLTCWNYIDKTKRVNLAHLWVKLTHVTNVMKSHKCMVILYFSAQITRIFKFDLVLAEIKVNQAGIIFKGVTPGLAKVTKAHLWLFLSKRRISPNTVPPQVKELQALVVLQSVGNGYSSYNLDPIPPESQLFQLDHWF